MTDIDALIHARTNMTHSALLRALVDRSGTGVQIAGQVNSAAWHLTEISELLDQAIDQALRDLTSAKTALDINRIPNQCGILQYNGLQVEMLTGRLVDGRTRLQATRALAVHFLDLHVRTDHGE